MAEDSENKQKFILNKKKETPAVQDKQAEPTEKKKVVVVKKKTTNGPSSPEKPETVAPQGTNTQPQNSEKKQGRENNSHGSGRPQGNTERKNHNEQRSNTTFEISTFRPNVQMGNIAEKGRGQNRGCQ